MDRSKAMSTILVSTRNELRSVRTEKSTEEICPQDMEFRQDQDLPEKPRQNLKT